jgi:hypothetical protein
MDLSFLNLYNSLKFIYLFICLSISPTPNLFNMLAIETHSGYGTLNGAIQSDMYCKDKHHILKYLVQKRM